MAMFKMTVWLAVLLALAVCDGASVGDRQTDYDTIVVGLGAAGTTAASLLARAGKRVLGLEAQDRVGGRVNTVSCGDGIVELGAEWIHGTEGSPTYALALENNINITPNDLDENIVWSDRRFGDMKLFGEMMEATLEFVNDPPEQPGSLGDHISKRFVEFLAAKHPDLQNDTAFITEYLSFTDLVIGAYEGCDDYHDVTTHSAFRELGGSQVMSWGRTGYKTLFQILLNTYKNETGLLNLTINLNTEVTKIVWPQEPSQKVVVRTKDGAEYTADNVIVTVSVGVLKDRHSKLFSPPLPEKKKSSIANISLGIVNKIVLLFSDPWWPVDGSYGFLWRPEDKENVPEEDQWITKVSGVSPPAGCSEALTLWTTGATARYIETLPEEVLKTKSMELLRKFLGGNFTITEPTEVIRSSWYSNPHTRGSYSFDNLQTPQHPSIRADLSEPLTDSSGQPRVLFAGEASEPTYFSTVHGAVFSGKREAARLLPNSNITLSLGSLHGRSIFGLSRSNAESKRITIDL